MKPAITAIVGALTLTILMSTMAFVTPKPAVAATSGGRPAIVKDVRTKGYF